MAEPTSPAPLSPAPTPPAPKRGWWPLRRLAFSFGAYLFGLVATAALGVGSVWWLLNTESGASWLLARVPGLQASGISGSLLGEFAVQQLELPLPGEGARLRLQQLRWSAPRIRPGGGSTWLRIGFDAMSAQRVDLWLSSGPSSDSAAPTDLALPLGLDVGALRIDEFHIDGLDTPLRGLRARVSLGADDGALHQLDALQLAWDRLQLSGRAQVGTRADLAVDAALQLTQQAAGNGEWTAALQLAGPLAAPTVQATLRAQADAARPAQTLDASATLHPFAAWPLGELQATARALDLSALHSDAPRTALDLNASARTQALDLPAAIELNLRNHQAGRWNEGLLPLRTLSLQLQARPDDPSQLDIQVGSSRVDLQACKLEYSIVSPK